MRAEIARQVADLKPIGDAVGRDLIGTDPASTSYVTAKERACEEAGMPLDVRVPAETTQEEALALVCRMNDDPCPRYFAQPPVAAPYRRSRGYQR